MTGVTAPGTPSEAARSPQRVAWVWPDDRPAAAWSGLKAAKLRVLGLAERTGMSRMVRDSVWRSRRLLILAYHGLSLRDEHLWSPELYLPPEALRARFELMRDGGYAVLPLREAVERLQTGTLPPRAVAITFDDGMQDFLAAGVPLLKEFGFPATVYVTTYYAEKQVPIFKIACRYMLWTGRDRTIRGDALTLSGYELDLRTTGQRNAALAAIEQRLYKLDGGVGEEKATLRRLAERVGLDFDRFLAERRLQVMSPDEIRTLPTDLVEVQLHTHRHRVPLLPHAFAKEIEENRRALASWRPAERLDSFCYPSGVTDPRFLPWLQSLDIHTGLTCETGIAGAATDPLLLPRLVDTTALTRLEFEAWLTGVGSLLQRIRKSGGFRPQPGPD